MVYGHAPPAPGPSTQRCTETKERTVTFISGLLRYTVSFYLKTVYYSAKPMDIRIRLF